MAVYYTPLPWSVCLTEHEHSLLSCFGQMSLLQMAYFDLCVRPNHEVRPQAIAILWAIINAGHDGLRLVVRLRRELLVSIHEKTATATTTVVKNHHGS